MLLLIYDGQSSYGGSQRRSLYCIVLMICCGLVVIVLFQLLHQAINVKNYSPEASSLVMKADELRVVRLYVVLA